jgi:hypothetical protein
VARDLIPRLAGGVGHRRIAEGIEIYTRSTLKWKLSLVSTTSTKCCQLVTQRARVLIKREPKNIFA